MTALATEPGVSAAPPRWRLTRADYYRLGELGFFRGRRVELVRGEVLVMSPIGSRHTVLVRAWGDALQAAFGPGFHARAQGTLSLAGGELGPDLAVVPGVPMDFYHAHPAAALLVVEVADTTLDYDLTTKAGLSAEAGVGDYWVADINARRLHVLRDPRPVSAGGHRYFDVRVLDAADAVAPLAAPGRPIRLADLLP